jgi:predicted methyltransferase
MRSTWFFAALFLFSCHKPEKHHHGPRGHSFESADEYAKRWNDPTRDEWQKPQEVVTLMQITPGMTVADIGAGTGYFTPFLSQAAGEGGKILALDIEADMIRYLGERKQKEGWQNVETRQVKTDDPMLAPGEAHRIVIVNTWHHIWEREKYGAKLLSGLAADGTLTIVDFTLQSKMGPKQSEKLSEAQVIEELKKAGFQAEIATETLPEQYVIIARPGVAAQ